MALWNAAGAFTKPKGNDLYEKLPMCEVNVAMLCASFDNGSW